MNMTIDEKINVLKEWNEAYRNGIPMVSDEIYDKLYDTLPEDCYYKNTVEPDSYKGRIKHTIPMLSMQKAKTEEDIKKWISNILDVCRINDIKLYTVSVKCTAKLDGIAGKLKDGKFITRGDGKYGNDVTNCIDKGIHFTNMLDGLGEFVVKLDYFKDNMSSEFSDPRSFVSGAIMADTLNDITKQAFNSNSIVFQRYEELPAKFLPILTLLKDFREAERETRESVNYEIDGVIFEVTNERIKRLMGATDHHPNWAIALKPKDKIYQSVITDIVWQTGRTGKVTPVVIIEPTNIDGVFVKRATAHNAKMIETLGLDIGVKIDLIRSGSVIPYIIGVSDE